MARADQVAQELHKDEAIGQDTALEQVYVCIGVRCDYLLGGLYAGDEGIGLKDVGALRPAFRGLICVKLLEEPNALPLADRLWDDCDPKAPSLERGGEQANEGCLAGPDFAVYYDNAGGGIHHADAPTAEKLQMRLLHNVGVYDPLFN